LTGELTIPNNVTTIESNAFIGCNNINGNLTIGNSVTSIGMQAFYGCNKITDISFSTSVSYIGQ
jgi:hypothetical protein